MTTEREKIRDLVELFEKISPDAMLFLERANPETLRWLVRARPEEIKELEDGLSLVRASKTVGRFTKWAALSIIGAFAATYSLADWIGRGINLLKGGH